MCCFFGAGAGAGAWAGAWAGAGAGAGAGARATLGGGGGGDERGGEIAASSSLLRGLTTTNESVLVLLPVCGLASFGSIFRGLAVVSGSGFFSLGGGGGGFSLRFGTTVLKRSGISFKGVQLSISSIHIRESIVTPLPNKFWRSATEHGPCCSSSASA